MVCGCLLRTQQCAELSGVSLVGAGCGIFWMSMVCLCQFVLFLFVGNGFERVQVSMESLILAQDERWRRA
jgi:hypothetical protein